MILNEKYILYKYKVIESTNNKAKELLRKSNVNNNLIITATKQTNGKGRNNKKWESPEGNIYMSIIIKHKFNSKIPILVALAVGDAILSVCPDINLCFKWPNDILIDEKKVCGILLEMDNNYNDYIIIGIGVNILTTPNAVNNKTTSLNQYNIVNEDLLIKIIINYFDKYLELSNCNFKLLYNKWMKKAYMINKKIEIFCNKTNSYINGIFIGINNNGYAIIKTENGALQEINTGEIFITGDI